jgi:hypothetical protein
VFAVLGDARLLGLILLPLLRLDLGHLLAGERLEVGRVLGVGLPTGRAEAVALRAQLVPAESANLKEEKKGNLNKKIKTLNSKSENRKNLLRKNKNDES